MNVLCEYKSKWTIETLASLHKFLNLVLKILKDWRKDYKERTLDLKK